MIQNTWLRYLNSKFIDKLELANSCNTSIEFIDSAIEAHALPHPSYVVRGSFSIESHINAKSESQDLELDYFPKAIIPWLNTLLEKVSQTNLSTAATEMERQFKSSYTAELNLRGIEQPDEIKERLDNTWKHFLLGTYGVCVKDISQVSNIASKQFAAMKLTNLTQNGEKTRFETEEIAQIKSAIEEYNNFTTDFGPWEFEKTSRKRLVNDILPRLEITSEFSR